MVSARYAPFVGGTEIHTGEVAAELSRRGHNVTVLATTWGQGGSALDENDVRVISTPAFPRGSDLHYAPGLRSAIANGDWDIVHVQGYHTLVAPMALAAAQRAGFPTALTFHSGGHSSLIRNALRPIHVFAMRKLMRNAAKLIAVSQFEASLFASRLGINPAHVSVIPNGVSRSTIEAPPLPETITDDSEPSGHNQLSTTILSIGRLVRYKGHHRIIRAMPKILRSSPDARLLIIGQGPYEEKLRRYAKRLGVADKVDFDFIPSDERERLEQILRDVAMVLVMSNYESHGMVAYEAIDAGVPVAVVSKTALRELVAAGRAQGIPPNASSQELADIVNRILQSGPEDNRPKVAASPVPTWDRIVDLLVDEYRSLLPSSAEAASERRGIAS